MRRLLVIALLGTGCYEGNTTDRTHKAANDTVSTPNDTGIPVESFSTWCYDFDSDGYGDPADCQPVMDGDDAPPHYIDNATDCNDSNPAVNPAATESCNGVDDNCDGTVDEGATTEFYLDADGDGFGGTLQTIWVCEAPSGYTYDSTDCNDADPRMFPGNEELCDELDNDCDGETDEDDALDAGTWYYDGDKDGFGGQTSITACVQPEEYSATSDDCDDYNDFVFPGAPEYCDGVDQDCDSEVDEGVTSEFYADTDGDNFGDAGSIMSACTQPTGYVTDASDCDDSDATINPAATEICNETDDDCDGATDEGVRSRFYADTDADGYGDASQASQACQAPTGYISDLTDCDDTSATTYPGASEYCDGIDNDCDGTSDEDDALDAATWYEDRDLDGYGNGASVMVTCYEPSGYVELDGDCDDSNAWFNPGADESDCTDPNDYNCDGSVGYMDLDNDGFAACEECDDNDSETFPGSTEFCNGLDDDCDGEIDEGSVDAPTWYFDSDDDGFGNAAYSIDACEAPMGYVDDATDCDDSLASTNPAATEYCDGHDDDCDGTVDEDDAADAITWYADADSDNYGNASQAFQACQAPTGYVVNSTDCLDTDGSVYPGASEHCDGTDEDCDGVVDNGVVTATWYTDADLDGYGDSSTAFTSCLIGAGEVLVGGDCDDLDATVNPAATEVCDGLDENCDGIVDDDCVFPDADGDGYSWLDCDDTDPTVNPAGTEVCDDGLDNDCNGVELDCNDVDDDGDDQTENEGDCDDLNAAIYSGQAENCGNGFDDNCDGDVDYNDDDCRGYLDLDGDSYAASTDCDDTNPDINPGAEDICDNGIDEDCDGSDLVCADIDADGDGFPAATDCDETDASVHPGATEVCGNGLDDDCDGVDIECAPTDGDGDGWLEADGDCDDSDSRSYPGASEICYDGADNDCNGFIDDGCPSWDADGDGYSTISDCDDTDATVYPGATEDANGIDDDCDGVVDEGTDLFDDDGDGQSEADGDCDDTDAEIYYGADEFCDGVDNDCDGSVDEVASFDVLVWYADADSDGFGDASQASQACRVPSGYSIDSTDCDDTDSSVHPYATEYCNGADDDCDGFVDEDLATATWYADADLDGYGDDLTAFTSCLYEAGMVLVGGDCDDANADIHPWAEETCEDDLDQDCDGEDDACPLPPTPGTDEDGDGYAACTGADDEVCDCDDGIRRIHPGVTEACSDGVDNNCDGRVDEEETICVANVDCVAEGSIIMVTIDGNISGSMRSAILPTDTITILGIEGYTYGGSYKVAYFGDWTSYTVPVFPDVSFMVYTMNDGLTPMIYAAPERLSTSGICSLEEDAGDSWTIVASLGT